MREKRNSAGLSMLEIIISVMILALVLVGLINVFVVSRGYMSHGRSRISASQLATVFLDPLQNEVRETDWDCATTNNLSVRPPFNGTAVPLDGVIYTPNYTITNDTSPAGTSLRKVTVNITWNETKF